MLIFLIGMMGSGKSTVGRQLAQELGYTFVDLDEYIERQEGESIAAIFERNGQERFRELERGALESIVAKFNKAVVATGGGAPCFYDNMAYMNLHGETIFLDVPVSAISSRLLATNLQTRPLLAGKTEAEINTFLTETLAHRRQFYEHAKHKLQHNSITASQLRQLLNH